MKKIKELFKPAEETKQVKLGLCLSGGAALGIAHIGVLQALNDNKIYPDVISGTSMGSIVGAIYAAGYTPAQMLQMIKNDRLYKLSKIMNFQPAFWKSGLSDHSSIENLLIEMIPNNSFEKLDKPLYVCVANLTNGEWEIKSEGEELHKWISASASVPGIFNPIKDKKMIYVDGGVLNNMPAQPLKEVCDVVIGSDVLPFRHMKKQLRSRDVLLQSIRMSLHNNSAEGRELCDFLIEPTAIEKFNEFDFEDYQSIYQHGYRAAVRYIAENPEILELQKDSPDA